MVERRLHASAGGDWAWIGRTVESRRSALSLIQDQVVSRTGNTISRSWLQQIERGESRQRRSPMKLAQLAGALEWPRDAFDYLVRGELPPSLPVSSRDGNIRAIEAKLDAILDLLRSREARPDSPAAHESD